MKKLILFLLAAVPALVFSQQFCYVDFGENGSLSSGNWNNVVATTRNQSGIVVNLNNDTGASTGITLTVDDSFDLTNNAGTTSPSASIPFPASSTRDSFFGSTQNFNNNTNPTGGFTLSGLDPSKYYSFTIFASRTGVTDNRETQYVITGATATNTTVYLNTSNNTALTVDAFNIQPTAAGTITLVASPGPNNNNSTGFYYLGAMKLVISDTPWSNTGTPSLSLNYPNGGNIWQVGDDVTITWLSQYITDLNLEISTDGGTTWNSIGTIPAAPQSYTFSAPNFVSSNAKVRLSGSGVTDQSDNNFQIISDNNQEFKIVVLGSSTAAGTGPSSPNNAWVWMYRNYLEQMDSRYDVVNLAQGGFCTYNILPTGTAIPAGVMQTINTNKNITQALSLNPDGIIINMPSNDAAYGYPVADQLSNYNLILNDANAQNVPVWITTPQPRNFGTDTTKLNIQLDMLQATNNNFGNMVVDFWTDFGVNGGNGILPQYDAGDGIHMNDAAHVILFNRIIAKGIHNTIRNAVLNTDEASEINGSVLSVYPNPVQNEFFIATKNAKSKSVSLKIYNADGKMVSQYKDVKIQNGKAELSKSGLQSGLYFMEIIIDGKTYNKKLLVK